MASTVATYLAISFDISQLMINSLRDVLASY